VITVEDSLEIVNADDKMQKNAEQKMQVNGEEGQQMADSFPSRKESRKGERKGQFGWNSETSGSKE
jgi:hypothetical protein